ncbi:MAG: hypothetical protein ACK4K0_03605 [Flavobacteriales bacterium]
MRFTTLITLATISLTAKAQELSKHIPTQSNTVITFNTSSISKQINKQEIKTLKVFKNLDSTLANYFVENAAKAPYDYNNIYGYNEAIVEEIYTEEIDVLYPRYRRYNLVDDLMLLSVSLNDDFGLSAAVPMHMFNRNVDSVEYTAFIAKISDKKKFDDFVRKMAPDKFQKQEKVVTKNYQYLTGNNNALIWNKDVVVFMKYDIKNWRFENYYEPEYYIEEPETDQNYYENYEQRLKDQKKKEAERTKKILTYFFDEIFTGGPGITMVKNEYFANAHKGSYDIALFSNTFANLFSGNNTFNLFGNKNTGKIMSLYDGNYTYGHMNFKEGKAEVNFYNVTNEKFGPVTKKMLDSKVNTNFLKYINGEKLLGLGGMAFNTDASDEVFYQLYLPMFESIERYGEGIASGVDIFYTFIDKKQLFSLVKGDILAAITDIKEFDVTYQNYQYDDDFNMTTVTETKKEIMPEYVVMLSSDNQNLLNKFFKLYESLELIVKKDHYYQVTPPSYSYSRKSNSEFYIAYHDGIVFFTNNFGLIEDLGKGKMNYPAVSDDIKKMVSKNYFGYWDMNKTVHEYNKFTRNNPEHAIPEAMKPFIEKFKSFTMNGIEVKENVFSNKIIIELDDKKENALKNIFNALIEYNKN